MPVDEIAAGDLSVGDVIRLGDPQAHRVGRVVVVDGSVVILEIRPVGLDVADAVRVTLLPDVVVDRLGTAGD